LGVSSSINFCNDAISESFISFLLWALFNPCFTSKNPHHFLCSPQRKRCKRKGTLCPAPITSGCPCFRFFCGRCHKLILTYQDSDMRHLNPQNNLNPRHGQNGILKT